MNPEALLEILNKIQNQKCETQTLENKSANKDVVLGELRPYFLYGYQV